MKTRSKRRSQRRHHDDECVQPLDDSHSELSLYPLWVTQAGVVVEERARIENGDIVKIDAYRHSTGGRHGWIVLHKLRPYTGWSLPRGTVDDLVTKLDERVGELERRLGDLEARFDKRGIHMKGW